MTKTYKVEFKFIIEDDESYTVPLPLSFTSEDHHDIPTREEKDICVSMLHSYLDDFLRNG